MSRSIQNALKAALISRGFSTGLQSPNDTIVLDEGYETAADLLELMVARRETIFRSVDVVGGILAKKSYDDVELAVDAIKEVIARLTLD